MAAPLRPVVLIDGGHARTDLHGFQRVDDPAAADIEIGLDNGHGNVVAARLRIDFGQRKGRGKGKGAPGGWLSQIPKGGSKSGGKPGKGKGKFGKGKKGKGKGWIGGYSLANIWQEGGRRW